ncbi:hypothetical protein FA10DRAFT_289437 [Acaromyces ingoldii]|uniref:Uncharacterized protein n=1 Tax=Acaromyces ingoldii TaxID=215250 RepID=A0A316YCA6_9BASI|nr:hypothetical protein FA10DRAFT_289437 [Acaromyces ingoldii]PWN86851.1 hypothetical protein FA10DRAFT_289437 [Acaromyces ingoldii]
MGIDELAAVCREEDVNEHKLHWPIFGLVSLDVDVAAAAAVVDSLQDPKDVTIGFLASRQGKLEVQDCGDSASQRATLIEAVARLWLRHFSSVGERTSTSVALSQLRAKLTALPTLQAHEELVKLPCDIFPFTQAHFSNSNDAERSVASSCLQGVDDLLPTLHLYLGPSYPSFTTVDVFGTTINFWFPGEEHSGHLRIYASPPLAFKTYKMDVIDLAQRRCVAIFTVARSLVDHDLFSFSSINPVGTSEGDDDAATAERWLVHGQQDVVCRVAQLSGGDERWWKFQLYFDHLEAQLRRRRLQKGDGAKSSRTIVQRMLEEEIVNHASLIAARLCDKQDWVSSGLQQDVHRLLNDVREGRTSHVAL